MIRGAIFDRSVPKIDTFKDENNKESNVNALYMANFYKSAPLFYYDHEYYEKELIKFIKVFNLLCTHTNINAYIQKHFTNWSKVIYFLETSSLYDLSRLNFDEFKENFILNSSEHFVQDETFIFFELHNDNFLDSYRSVFDSDDIGFSIIKIISLIAAFLRRVESKTIFKFDNKTKKYHDFMLSRKGDINFYVDKALQAISKEIDYLGLLFERYDIRKKFEEMNLNIIGLKEAVEKEYGEVYNLTDLEQDEDYIRDLFIFISPKKFFIHFSFTRSMSCYFITKSKYEECMENSYEDEEEYYEDDCLENQDTVSVDTNTIKFAYARDLTNNQVAFCLHVKGDTEKDLCFDTFI